MAINLTEAQVAELVAKVVREIRSEAPAAGHTWDATQYDGRKFVGVFDTMEEAIAAAEAGATVFDCGLLGMARSAGNCATELLVATFQRLGWFKDIDLYKLLDFLDEQLIPAM